MIYVHLLIGIIFGKFFGDYFFFILGSIIPDLDHIYNIIKNRLFTIKKIKETMKHEKKYNIMYKTPMFHSILGLILFSFVIYFFNEKSAFNFGIAYLTHLLIDWIDIDKKYYLYPLKIKFRGFLEIWSKPEQMLTVILILIIVFIYI